MTMPIPTSRSVNLDSAPPFARWLEQRRSILTGIGVGMATWPLVFGVAWLLWPTSPTVPPSDRVAYGLQLAAAPALVLLPMVLSCMRLFDRAGAENPFLGVESPRFKINQRVLANTVEQSAMFVPLLIALATRLGENHLKLLPIAVAVWCAGRLLFWAGYHVAPHWRAPGFDWTLMTTVLLAGVFVLTLL